MSHGVFASPLVLEPHRSRYLLIYLLLVHALALLVLVGPIELPAWLRFVMAAAVISSFLWQVSRLPPRRLMWETDDDWQLLFQDGSEQNGELRPDSYVSPLLVVLRFRLPAGGTRSVLILPDMLDRQSFRRLRVRLYQTRLAEAAEETAL